MIKGFKKILKNKKGFTLIELIAVIAILGILMAIAVPRVIGFTDQARIQADRQQASIIANAFKILVATGDIKVTATGNFELSGDTDAGLTVGNASAGVDPADISDLIADYAELDKGLEHYETIVVTYDNNGNVTTMVGKRTGSDDETFKGAAEEEE